MRASDIRNRPNESLQRWLLDIGAGIDIDHVTLRRYLVDEGYLRRDAQGHMYEVSLSGRNVEFEENVDRINASEVVELARERTAARRRERGHS